MQDFTKQYLAQRKVPGVVDLYVALPVNSHNGKHIFTIKPACLSVCLDIYVCRCFACIYVSVRMSDALELELITVVG